VAADRLRVALIGAGDITRYHLAAWRAAPDADLVAICDLDPARAVRRAAEHGGAVAHTDAAAMLAHVRPDAVDIAAWRDSHAPLTRLAAAHGVHVLCQKPLAGSYAEAEKLTADVTGRIRLMVNENRRFAPHVRRLRQWLDDGRIGAVRQVTVTVYNSSMLLRPDGIRAAVSRAAHFGQESRLLVAGALTHHLDVLRYLLGPLDLATARIARTEDGVPGETVATLLLTTATGAPVVLQGNAVAPGFADAPSARAGGRNGERIDLIGSRSTALWQDDVLRLIGAETDEQPFDPAAGYQECFDAAVRHFVAGLRTGAEFETSAEDNLRTLALVEQAYAASSRDSTG
jgi:predicted dehydrogenase